MNKSEIKTIVELSPSSIFCRADVLALIEKLDEGNGSEKLDNPNVSEDLAIDDAIQELLEAIEAVENIDSSDVDVELELNGMELEITSASINGLDDALGELVSAAKHLRAFVRRTG